MKAAIITISFLLLLMLVSCSDAPVQQSETETLLYEKPGLVDSAVVYGCYAHTVRFFADDTLSLASYNRVKIMFDGLANSDGTVISLIYNTADTAVFVYEVMDEVGINKIHTFEFTPPAANTWFEVRFYINPPVCGTGEFKYTRARDLKIIGIR